MTCTPRPLRAFRSPRFLIPAFLALVIVGAVGLPTLARQSPAELVRQGNKDWDEQSWELAIESYQKALTADPNLPDKPEIEYRVAVGLGRAQKWDAAVEAIEAYVQKYRDTRYEAKGQIWRGRLYTIIQHGAYRVGKKILRGTNVPKTEGKDAPVAIDLSGEDYQKARTSFHRAKFLYERFRRQNRDPVYRAELLNEEIELNFDLANFYLPQFDLYRPNLQDYDWEIDLSEPFNPAWLAPKKVMTLYEQIIALDALRPGSDRHDTVLATLGKATYILQLRQMNRGIYYPQEGRRGRGGFRPPRPIPMYIPYQEIDPILLVQSILDKYPNDREADRLAYTVALWTQQKGDMLKAVGLYNAFIMRYPKSRWVSDARGQLDFIFRPELSVNVPAVTRPGHRAVISMTTRNLKQVRFTAYRVYLEEIFGKVEYRVKPETPILRPYFSDFNQHFLNGRVVYRKEKIAEWTATTGDDGKHGYVNDSVTTPLDTLGAYLIEARGGSKDEVGASTLAIVTDFILAQKVDRSSALLYAAEGESGKPLDKVKLVVWAPTFYYTDDQTREAKYLTGETNSEGTARIPLPEPVDASPAYPYIRRRAQVFAMAGPNRYAITYPNNEFYAWDIPFGERAFRAFVQTDRSLYRPKQMVNIRATVTEGYSGNYRPAVDKEVTLFVNGPRGQIMEKVLKTGPFGSVSESLTLPPDANLGDYSVTVQPRPIPPYGIVYGATTFRIEEYKKPEFAVRVAPEKSQVRVGENIKVIVSATYFFGAPVAGAKVHYRVFRAPYVYSSPFRPRLDWYGEGGYTGGSPGRGGFTDMERPEPGPFGDPNTAYREGDLVTDAQGQATITFPTTPPKLPKGRRWGPGAEPDQSFTIIAEVVDDSRRQVTGAGSAKATATQFRAFMQVDRRFLQAGDTLRLEVRARDGGDKPVSTKGYITLYRQIPAIPERKERDPKTGKEVIVQKFVPAREEKEGILFVETDAAKEGVGYAYWHPETPAEYRFEFNAKDAWGNKITTSAFVLVYGPNYDSRLNKDDQQFFLLPELAEYRPGDVARVLLVTPKPDSYVMFTESSVGSIRRVRTLFVPGRSTIVNVPITGEHVPNMAMSAWLVRDNGAREAIAEVGVPAEGQILKIQLTPDKPTYKPGEKATFKLVATDANGKPVRGEFSLSVVDEALLAIQPDLTQDIRRYYYGYRMTAGLASAESVNYSIGAYTFAPVQTGYETHELRQPEGMSWLRDRQSGGNQPGMPPYVAYTPPSVLNTTARYREATYYGMRGFGGGRGANGPAGEKGDLGLPAMESREENLRDNYFAESAALGMKSRAFDAPARKLEAADKSTGQPPGQSPGAPLVEATVRRLFADTAFWTPAIVTDADGTATITFDFPDNITEWRAVARGLTGDIKVGVTEAQVVVKKNLLVRLQAPRFFVDRDRVVLSANVHNYLEQAKSARIELVTESDRIALTPDAAITGGKAGGNDAVRTLQIGKDDEIRVDWTVDVKKAGLTKIKVVAQTDQESDAAEMEFPVLVHGVEKFIVRSGILRNGGEASVTIDLPEARRKGDSLLNIQMQPSIASLLIDALPYLEDYPYGCVEQTLSRFLPTTLVAKSLRDAGIDLETLGKRAKALEEQRRSIPPQKLYEDSGYTYPKGIPGVLDAKTLASRLAYTPGRRSNAPIFDSGVLKAMTDEGLQRLYTMQRGDGGWGWWQGSDTSDPYLTALIVEGLTRLTLADVNIRNDALDRGLGYLKARLNATEDLQLLAYYVEVLTLRGGNGLAANDPIRTTANDHLYKRRDRMNSYGKALLALALHNLGENAKAQVLARNLVTLAKRDKDGGNVHWEGDGSYSWRWYNDKQETTATVLRALVAVLPDEQLAPKPGAQADQTGLAPLAVRWLVDNRRSGFWTSTRQTATVVSALLEYAKAQKELAPDYTVTVNLDGKVEKTYKIDRENALLFDNRFLVGDEILSSGAQKANIVMRGTGTLYYSAYLKYFDMTEPITGVANAIGVERKYYKIVPTIKKDRQGQSVTTTERVPLKDGAALVSGDILEVELFLKSDNDYEYLVFEDMKPAGCEAVETRSGVAYGDGLCSNFELRDEKVAFFVDRLPQGTRRITYRLRAEIPGEFHALPTNAYAMYAPDIRALSDEWRVTIADAPPRPAPSKNKKK